MKRISEVVLTNADGTIMSDVQIIAALNREGQKRISFEELSDYCKYKKTIDFFKKKFRKFGYVPNFYVKDDFFYLIKVTRYTYRGHLYESPSCIPLCRAYGRFKKYELKKQ